MAALKWSDFSAHEIRKALESAPKVAGPWRKGRDHDGTTYWERPSAISAAMYRVKTAFSAADRRRIDAALVAAGWLLDDEED